MSDSTNGEWVRTVPCKDAGDRDRAFHVLISESPEGRRIALQPPPGEAGFLTSEQATALKRALSDAQVELGNRGGMG